MNAEELRAAQAPLKARYRDDPSAAKVEAEARGTLDGEAIACHVQTPRGTIDAGLHPATGGDGSWACSADMLLESLVACAGVTLRAVATTLGIPLKGGEVRAEAVFDARGTLGVSKEVPVGIESIRLHIDIDADATEEQRQTLLKLTERYCVIEQTLKNPPRIEATLATRPGAGGGS